MQYRTWKNYIDPTFWATRVTDKVILCVLLASVYWGLGDEFTVDNFTNVTAIFVTWSAFSAYGASVYIPNLYTGLSPGFFRLHWVV